MSDKIYEEVMTKVWKENRRAFTQFYGREDLDFLILLPIASHAKRLRHPEPRIATPKRRLRWSRVRHALAVCVPDPPQPKALEHSLENRETVECVSQFAMLLRVCNRQSS